MKEFVNKLTSIVSAAVLVLSTFVIFANNPVLAFAEGDGSEENPFRIENCADLVSVDDDLTKSYLLVDDLDCTADGNDASIANQSTGFSGTFDGNGHTITLDIDTGLADQSGFIRRASSGAQIRELIVTGSISGNYETGGLIGLANDAEISNVTVEASVSGGRYVGGIVGNANNTTVVGSSASGSVASASTYAGGAVGRAYAGSIDSTTASGHVTGQNYVGGLVGYSDESNIRYSSASGLIEGNDNVGGLLGAGTYSSRTENIFHSHATGNVSGRYSVGGLVGELPNAAIQYSYATGSVTAPSGDDVGGLVGRGVGGIELTIGNSYATGSVSAGGDVGGVIGYGNSSTSVTNVYASGALTTSSPYGLGGLVGGGDSGPITNSFWDTSTTGAATACYGPVNPEDCGGTGLATGLMKTAQTFTDAGWDFDTVWSIDSEVNNGYPYLISRPYMVCEQAHVTATTGRVACELTYDLPPNNPLGTVWDARYRIAGEEDWTYVDIDDSSVGRMTFHDLEPATEYQLAVRPSNALFAQWGHVEVSTRAVDSDIDSDGILDIVENDGPNRGDANGDGVLDAEQAAITSVANSLTGGFATLESSCTSNDAVSVIAESSEYKDAGHEYGAGLLSFTSSGCGSEATFTQYFFGDYDPSKTIARKYNTNTHQYVTLTATLSTVTIGGKNALKIVYNVGDNSSLDEDSAVGVIKDPSGPATLSVGVPNTGLNPTR